MVLSVPAQKPSKDVEMFNASAERVGTDFSEKDFLEKFQIAENDLSNLCKNSSIHSTTEEIDDLTSIALKAINPSPPPLYTLERIISKTGRSSLNLNNFY